MKEAIVPEIYDDKIFDEKIQVKDEIVHETVRTLALTEGIFVGLSTGAALTSGLDFAKKLESGNIVVISHDRGEKYLSTILFE